MGKGFVDVVCILNGSRMSVSVFFVFTVGMVLLFKNYGQELYLEGKEKQRKQGEGVVSQRPQVFT